MKLLLSDQTLTRLAKQFGIHSWEELIDHVRSLTYGRNANREDFSLVLKEEKGSCSSKHALLKSIALENDFSNVKLLLGIYRINGRNTRGISTVLDKYKLSFIPEAHCYLSVDGQKLDCTFPNSSFETIQNDLLEEVEIQPEQVVQFKIDYHQNFLKQWITNNTIPYSFEEIWKIREACIHQLQSK